ncbi:unnamed protein product [Parnassius mnemosyne]|uniref:Ommochrome-binding protein n=1 Tax=Parnassius mnemosyne TaxID=213953 RepID=A0AAV1LLA0_9NEOP
MKLLATIFLVIASTTADKRCHGIYFNGKYYNIDIIKEGVNRLDSLILNRNDNTLYFTFEQIDIIPNRLVGYMNMETKETKVIDGIQNASSVAIDQKFNRVYVGSRHGLYKINDFKQAERLPIQDDVRSVFFKDVLYFVNTKGEVYRFVDGFGAIVRELHGVAVDDLIIDNDYNMLFVSDKALFRIKLGTRAVNIHEKITVDVLSTDIYSKAYVCATNGVYIYNKYKYALDKVAVIGNLRGLTFNRANEPIYAVGDLIIKLSENEVPCFEN